jgi:integrase
MKTWQRKSSWPKGLLRHKGGWFFARLSSGGKPRFVALKTDNLQTAKERATQIVAENEATRNAAAEARRGVAKMSDVLTLYRERLKTRQGVSERTRELNLGTADYIEKTWPGFASLRPSEIKISMIDEWRNRALANGTGFKAKNVKVVSPRMAGRSASSFNKAVDMLRRMLDLAVDHGALTTNVLTGRRGLKAPDKPKKPTLPDTPTLQAIFTEIESVGGKGIPAAELCRGLAFTGMRRNEAAGLVMEDLDFEKGIVRVRGTKTDAASREVPMIPAARALFEKIAERLKTNATELVDGKPHVPKTTRVFRVKEAQKSLDRACKKLNVERLTHHDLRDAFATTCIESGVDVPTVAAWLGHADGGALLMRVYQHHRRPHSIAQAAKVNFGGAS